MASPVAGSHAIMPEAAVGIHRKQDGQRARAAVVRIAGPWEDRLAVAPAGQSDVRIAGLAPIDRGWDSHAIRNAG